LKNIPSNGFIFAILIIIADSLCGTLTARAASKVIAWGGSDCFPVPSEVTNLAGALNIFGGYWEAFGLMQDGKVVGSGCSPSYVNRVPSDWSNVVAISVSSLRGEDNGFHLALRADGIVVPWLPKPFSSSFTKAPPVGLSNVVAIASGLYDALALKNDGTVVGWGFSSYSLPAVPIDVPLGLMSVVAIADGNNFRMALKADGTVVVWGHPAYSWTVNVPSSASNVVAIAAGFRHAIALRADGRVVAWGDNTYGQTGVPKNLSNVVAIATDGLHNLALKSDGTVSSWGGSYYYPVQQPPLTLTNVAAIAAAGHGLALVGDGPPFLTSPLINLTAPNGTRVWQRMSATGAWPLSFQWFLNGNILPGETNGVLGLSNLQSHQAGVYSVTVSNAFGTASASNLVSAVPFVISIQPSNQFVYGGTTVSFQVVANGVSPQYQWRFNGTSIPGATNSSLRLANIQLAQAGLYSVIVSNHFGTVVSSNAVLEVAPLGITSQPKSQYVAEWSDITLTCTALGISPLSFKWQFNGMDLPGATNSSLTLTNLQYNQSGIYTLSVSNAHALIQSQPALISVGQVAFLGVDTVDPAGLSLNLTNLVAVANGMALKRNGTVVGLNLANQPLPLSNVVAIAHGLALLADGTVVSWLRPGMPADLTNVVAISSGTVSDHVLVLKADGRVVGWGANWAGQADSPPGLTNVVGIATGGSHNLAVKSDGTVATWGSGSAGQIYVAGLSNVVAVSAGAYHSLVLRSDGTVVAWGDNLRGASTVPPGLRGVVGIAGGHLNGVALKSDGKVAAWGSYCCSLDPFYVRPDLRNLAALAGDMSNLALVGDGPPFVVKSLVGRVAGPGETTFLRVEASGSLPLSYQWRFNGANLPGATNVVLVLTNLQYPQAGMYSVVVSNAFGSVASSPARLRINRSPIADASATPPIYISCNGNNTAVLLDGSRSSDPDNDPLHYSWVEHGETQAIATGVASTATLSVGTHEISLLVSDGLAISTNSVTVTILTPHQAVEKLIATVETHALRLSPLVSTLKAALDSIRRDDPVPASNQLQAFQNKVNAQVLPTSRALAETLNHQAQQVMGALDCRAGKEKVAVKLKGIVPGSGGRLHVLFTGDPTSVYLIEASTNLLDWVIIGATAVPSNGESLFDGGDTTMHPKRFYRLRSP
jgi:hypothetical protein